MCNNKLNKRQVQAQMTKEKIYLTALRLIEKNGFENITVEEICKTASVSIGSFYNCFKSKNDILNEIYRVADDYFLDTVASDLKKGNMEDKIAKFFSYYAQYNLSRGITFMRHLYNSKNKLFITKGRHMQNVLENVIEEGQASGEISNHMSPRGIVEYLFIAARGLVYDWCLHNGEYDLVEHMYEYMKPLIKIFIVTI
ncbi:TetR/AcrR family transcriptional regulator [Clostridium malenominatum]|uniref:TetR/AcrR family transcriptional regulator n=1 Tax=Clostridium malenominatum TaxID=1539 RepID=A0ABN1IPZ9_9CLOT